MIWQLTFPRVRDTRQNKAEAQYSDLTLGDTYHDFCNILWVIESALFNVGKDYTRMQILRGNNYWGKSLMEAAVTLKLVL